MQERGKGKIFESVRNIKPKEGTTSHKDARESEKYGGTDVDGNDDKTYELLIFFIIIKIVIKSYELVSVMIMDDKGLFLICYIMNHIVVEYHTTDIWTNVFVIFWTYFFNVLVMNITKKSN